MSLQYPPQLALNEGVFANQPELQAELKRLFGLIAVTLTDWQPRLDQSVAPSGAILAFGGTAAPDGWLLCNGTSYLRTDYVELFDEIGTAYGTADATHFNVPDFRGRFLRGVDGATARDPDAAGRTAMAAGGNTGDAVGSIQADATNKNSLALTDPGHTHSTDSQGAHTHTTDSQGGHVHNPPVQFNSQTLGNQSYQLGANVDSTGTIPTNGAHTHTALSGGAHTHTAASNTTGITLGAGDNETRPLNAYVNYIIKT